MVQTREQNAAQGTGDSQKKKRGWEEEEEEEEEEEAFENTQTHTHMLSLSPSFPPPASAFSLAPRPLLASLCAHQHQPASPGQQRPCCFTPSHPLFASLWSVKQENNTLVCACVGVFSSFLFFFFRLRTLHVLRYCTATHTTAGLCIPCLAGFFPFHSVLASRKWSQSFCTAPMDPSPLLHSNWFDHEHEHP